MITSWKLSTCLHTWGQPSRTTCRWTWSSTNVLGRPQRRLPASPHASGRAPNSPRRQRWQCATLASSIHCCTAAKLGSPTPSRKGNSTIPPALPSANPSHLLVRQGFQHRGPLPCRPSMYTILRQRRLRWLGIVRRMEDGRIPKDILYGELSNGQRAKGRPQLRYKDVCKRNIKAVGINIDTFEDAAVDRSQ